MGGGGGGGSGSEAAPSLNLPHLDHKFENLSELSSQDNDTQRDDLSVNKVDDDELKKFTDFDGLGISGSLTSSELEILQRKRLKVYQEIMKNYNNLEMRIGGLKEAKVKIISYKPGAWIEEVGGTNLSHYDIPKKVTLLLVGPSGSGKSSLVNKILRAFEEDKFVPDSAQVSYNSFAGDGTYFLHQYMVPRRSTTSFCLCDTRSLSVKASENFKTLKRWMLHGVCHGKPVIRGSDDSTMRKNRRRKARAGGYCSKEKRMVNFVIFVVNGLSVLKSMDNKVDAQYMDLVHDTFSCPYLSFKDDKPLVVITHGDLLSYSDRASVRIHLGELLGIPPDTQIFDIPDKCGVETELAVMDMLRYSLEHADRNLPLKEGCLKKVMKTTTMIHLVFAFLFIIWRFIDIYKDKIQQEKLRSEAHINWHKIRHLW